MSQRKIIRAFFSLLLVLGWLSGLGEGESDFQSYPCAVTGVESGDVLNLRAQPHYRSKQLGTISHDAQTVLKLGPVRQVGKSDWFRVQYERVSGWVNAKFLVCHLAPEEAKARLERRAREVVMSLHERDLSAFATYAHPVKGVRFSPYAWVNLKEDLTFSADRITSLADDAEKRQWGYYDGSGDPIMSTFAAYFSEFIYDRKFAMASAIGYNETIRTGNTTNNSLSVYPHGQVVEFHLPGTSPKGMDWASLRLVFEELEGKWYVVGVIHDQWTT
ncbi:MAG: hypothetical protein ETSY1_29670 [Candidatus Entotheonella factor]|uniref:SH3b domain-containing protein n=1 Tax=Entotheonella factor TaxID=1429438 RepID=W4LD59_ENTF1|nr:SH3 domain-containing protein [Candidatus Entotheonella palauensis]ETW95660.1 MAG: hypothetical protein ETSY1_29670 [Candidatus Entotheonella factor]